jgi:RNA 2',3'-cyclic 3'-phosphodiesterase
MTAGNQVLYFALQPPAEVARQAQVLLEPLIRRHRLTGRPVAAERLHVSLNGLGRFTEVPAQVVETASRAASAVTARPFKVAFNRLGTWGRDEGPRPVVLHGDDGVIGVEALHDAIHEQLARPGMARGRPRPFWAHMTLLRDLHELAEQFVEPTTWTVREFVLIQSAHGEGRHTILGRWPLAT